MPSTHEQPDVKNGSAFLGDMYARWTLDCLVEVAHAISIDYFSNPEFYQGDDAPDEIVDLWLSYGSLKNFPDKTQRHILAATVFGESDGYPSPTGVTAYNDDFHNNRDTLFKACIAAQTATSAQSREGLDQNVRNALPNLQSYLGGFPGKAVRLAHEQIKAVSDVAFEILRSKAVSSRFISVHTPAISPDWPLKKADANGDKLIGQCIATLKIDVKMKMTFPDLRTLAHTGGEALDTIVQPSEELKELITQTYSWAMFTGDYEPYKASQ